MVKTNEVELMCLAFGYNTCTYHISKVCFRRLSDKFVIVITDNDLNNGYNINRIKAALVVYIVGKCEEKNWHKANDFQKYVPFSILDYEVKVLEMLDWNIYKHTFAISNSPKP